jgi:site-specific DNA recombinase
MSAQAALEGRFLGGRPPYGYRIADAGPHPNPAKAADGKRLHKLEPDPDTAGLVGRIFAEYLAGRGLFAIAEGLTRDRIPSPSQQDRARNRHWTGEGWSKSAVRTILCNPRYTGRQVWNEQRKDGILLDVNDVAAGYETRMRWNQAGSWVWSDAIVHEPLIPAADFDAAQAIMADAGRARRTSREAHQWASHPYVLRGRLYCGYCGRRMQGQYSNHAPYYRCRYPREYALASHVRHPGNIYLREADLLPAIDAWLVVIFAPHRLEQTSARCKRPRTRARTPPRPPGPAKTLRLSSLTVTPGLPATRLPLTPEPTRRPWPSGPARSRPSAAPRSPATPARTATPPSASSPKTTSAPSSPASATCATSSAMLRPP